MNQSKILALILIVGFGGMLWKAGMFDRYGCEYRAEFWEKNSDKNLQQIIELLDEKYELERQLKKCLTQEI